jgi:hypothetical protein
VREICYSKNLGGKSQPMGIPALTRKKKPCITIRNLIEKKKISIFNNTNRIG